MLRRRITGDGRFRRKRRIRKKISGTAARPRLTVYRSNKHIYAQVVNDETGHTMVSASTLDEAAKAGELGKKDAARAVGKLLAERAKESG